MKPFAGFLGALLFVLLTTASATYPSYLPNTTYPRWLPIGDAPNAFLSADKELANKLAVAASSSDLGLPELISTLTPEAAKKLLGVKLTADWATNPYKVQLLADAVRSFFATYTPVNLLAWLRNLSTAPVWTHSGALSKPQPPGTTAYGNAPNWDTVYSLTWVELAQGAWELSVPPIHGRFYSASVLDPYQNVIAKFGTIDGAVDGYRALLLGPTTPRNAVDAWKAAVRSDTVPTRVVEAPSDGAFVILRIGLLPNITNDYALNVAPYQAKFALRPWKFTPTATYPKYNVSLANPGTPAPDFFTAGSAIITELLPPPGYLDGRPGVALARFNLADKAFNFSALGQDEQTALTAAVPLGHLLLDAGSLALYDFHFPNNWVLGINNGRYGPDHYLNAIVAKFLPLPNYAEESIYPATFYDAQGAPLTGANGTRYTIHFPGPLPYDAAKGWWSLIAYNKQAALIANPINRQALNDRTQGLKVNKDGSFTVYVQAEQPTDPDQFANWLPVHADAFWLVLRLYKPTPAALWGQWAPPNVTRVTGPARSRKLML